MKILFITPYSSEGASNRYRVEQYLPYLKEKGFSCYLRPFVSSEFYKIIYKKGMFFKKVYFFLKALCGRVQDIFLVMQYDIIFIHREACPYGPPLFEWLFCRFKKPVIYDFDDAIFLNSCASANNLYRFLKFPSKVKQIIRMASCVIVANRFLLGYASQFNNFIYVLPTPIDTNKFAMRQKNNFQLVIGWIGSPTTAPYLRILYDVFEDLSSRYDFVLKIIGAGSPIVIPGVQIENLEWSLKEEVNSFQSIDIGVYPLPDITWARGKAGFKAIQYMSVGIPVVASPIGMTGELIEDGIDGFLAYTREDWIIKIGALIENPALRKKIGINGREKIEKSFSLGTNAPKFVEILEKHANCYAQ